MAKHTITTDQARIIEDAIQEYIDYSDETRDQAVDYLWSGDGASLRSDLEITTCDLEAWENGAVA